MPDADQDWTRHPYRAPDTDDAPCCPFLPGDAIHTEPEPDAATGVYRRHQLVLSRRNNMVSLQCPEGHDIVTLHETAWPGSDAEATWNTPESFATCTACRPHDVTLAEAHAAYVARHSLHGQAQELREAMDFALEELRRAVDRCITTTERFIEAWERSRGT